jgi:hypothetical protein
MPGSGDASRPAGIAKAPLHQPNTSRKTSGQVIRPSPKITRPTMGTSVKIAAIPEKNPGATDASNHPNRNGGVPTVSTRSCPHSGHTGLDQGLQVVSTDRAWRFVVAQELKEHLLLAAQRRRAGYWRELF